MVERDLRFRWAMDSPEDVVLLVRYRRSLRFISPCHCDGENCTAFDLSRQDYRTFNLTALQIICLVWAFSIHMPVPMLEALSSAG